MADERVQRRLAAILAADVVGYSRLMEQNETGTLAALKAQRRDVLDPLINEHRGRIIKVIGDGVLVEFASAVDAVSCAVEMQRRSAEGSANLSEESPIVLRIGVNLGDIIVENDDLYGDGVNIAARLEALAEPGGICISAKVHDEVHGKMPVVMEDIGLQPLKNIERPIRVYRVRIGSGPASTRTGLTLPDKPSIAVLPFQNLSGDPEQEYFVDGMVEDIITALSRFRSLFVIARNSSFQYRGKAVDIRRVGRELGVRYVVEGSVRKSGDRMRITAQLIDALSGSHIWSESYDRQLADVFAVQDEVTRTVAATLVGRLEEAEIGGATRRPTGSMAAYDMLLQGIEHLRGYEADDNRLAWDLFERALTLDPNFALAHSYLALAMLSEHDTENAPETIKQRALGAALAGVRLDGRDSMCHAAAAHAYLFLGKFDLALSHFERVVALNPNDANCMASHGYALALAGRATEGCALIRQAMRLNPFHPDWYWGDLAVCLHDARRYEEALEAGSRFSGQTKIWHLARQAACHARLDRTEEAHALAIEVLRLKPDFRVSTEKLIYRNVADVEHLRDGMRKAGLPE